MNNLLSYPEAAEILSVSEITLRKWVSARKIEHLKIGRSVRFTPEQIENFLHASVIPAGGRR